MKTVSTKLDKKTAQKFLDICNDEGKCQSELLRDMIENICEVEDDGEYLPLTSRDLEIKIEDVKPTIKVIPTLQNPIVQII